MDIASAMFQRAQWGVRLSLIVIYAAILAREVNKRVDVSLVYDNFLLTDDSIAEFAVAAANHPTVIDVVSTAQHHIQNYGDVSDGINTWFLGVCVILLEVLDVFLRYNEFNDDSSTSKRVYLFVTRKVPVVSFLFVMLGTVYFLLENLSLLKQFNVYCIWSEQFSMKSIMLSYLTSFTFSKELFFWGNMKMVRVKYDIVRLSIRLILTNITAFCHRSSARNCFRV
jgi:hypothetical protein